jgi:eukaryotic-like serine/threonine-protein kinase
MPFPSGHRLGPYDIVALLGSGGMGEVYRARDTRLGREVALKVLPPALTEELSHLERFDREARAIAALNHPHIVTIYSTEEVEGVKFITMELIDGQTLDHLIADNGLSLAHFLDLALPLADALAAAHQKHITHRDLKPANVMVSQDGRVKVLDFGLARIEPGGGGDDALAETVTPVTRDGVLIGTVPYMSPEQVEGHTLDARSDIFSLGVMFYEMLTGRRPFTGGSTAALMSAILRDRAPDIRERRADVPAAIAQLIARSLEKNPEARVQTARELFDELHRQRLHLDAGSRSLASQDASAPTLNDSRAIAVLPFTVRGTERDVEAFASGLGEDITAGLSKFAGLTIVAAHAVRAYEDAALDARQIAERLGARYVVSGQVRQSSSAVRVAAQVVDIVTSELLWSETYDRRLGELDLFGIQDDLTDRIVATIADQGGVVVQSMVRSIPRDGSPTAERLVLRSWAFQHNPTLDEHAALRTALEARVEVQPDAADLWASLAHVYVLEHSLWFNPLPDPLARAQRAARRAIELDARSQSAWHALASTCFHLHDGPGLEDALERAVRSNPRNATTLAWMGTILTHAGEHDRGCGLVTLAMDINPSHPGWLHVAVFNRHFARGDYDEALSAARRVNTIDSLWMHFGVATAAGHLGRTEEARAAADEMMRLAPFLSDAANLREFVSRWYWPEALVASLLEGMSLARVVTSAPTPEPRAGRPLGPFASIAVGPLFGRGRPPAPSGAPRQGIVLGVRPFGFGGSSEVARAVAENLTAEAATALARLPNIRVIAQPSAQGAALERYAVEGDVRSSGRALRVHARLTEIATGVHAWADSYTRDASDDVFGIVDDVASLMVAGIEKALGDLRT